jgi:hypothetical protein
MRALELVVLWIAGLGFVAFGALFVLDPIGTIAQAGIVVSGAVAAAELRAFYGGLELALGGLICVLALKPQRRRDALTLTAVCDLGIGLARLSGMLQFGADNAFLRLAVATELTLGIAAALLARRAS